MQGFVRGAIKGALLVWTVHWAVATWAYLQQHSIVVQQGFGGDGIQMWEVFNIQMIAAHTLVRWLGGVVIMLLMLRFLRQRARITVRHSPGRDPSPCAAPPAANAAPGAATVVGSLPQ